MEQLLNENELAELTNLAVGTLQQWRCTKSGPPYLKLGRAVRYRASDVLQWLDTSVVVVAA